MKLDNMDYLRQQIEASLGRSEELILLDKAKCGVFYRYPGEPPPSAAKKRSPKERGTFNSVRLKKYLGLGSKRKQKDNEDDNSQPHQIYLGELQRYGSYYDPNQFPLYQAEYHRNPYDGGSVSVGRSLHYPNMYASVSVRSPHSRGTVYGVYPWSPSGPPLISNMNVLTEIAPLAIDRPEAFDTPCTCEESEVKSKRHRNTCTCSPGTRSKWWTKRLSRPSLFHGGDACGHEDHVNQIEGIKKREGQITAKANEYERTPLAKSRLHRLSDLSSSSNNSNESSHDVFSKAAADFRETVPTRKSILECPVNPYELVNSNRETPKQQTIIKKNISHDYEDIDDRFNGLLKKDIRKNSTVKTPSSSKARKSVPNSFRSISSGSRYRMDDDTENDTPAISLGGQRIRLFGTVNGVGSSNKAIKRPSLPSFSELSTLDNKKSPHDKNLSEKNSNFTNKNLEINNKSFDSPSKTTTKVSPFRSSDDWSVEREEDFINQNKPSKTTPRNDLSPLSPQSGKSRKTVQHKTKIAIGGERTKSEAVPQNISFDIENESKTSRESTYVNVGTESDRRGSWHSVIPVNENSHSKSNKLNLRINFNELSAYLKPILKKSSYIESSPTSSEAEGSETYSLTPSVNTSDENIKQKQKKHVHFLSNRQLSSSSEFNSQSGNESEEETSNSRDELSSNARANNNNVLEEDSDRETGSSESESFRNGNSESEDELLSSSSSSTQDLYDDGVSITKQNSDGMGMVDDRCIRWSPESHSSGHSNCGENGILKNVKFATLNDDMAVIGIEKSNSAEVKKFNLRRSLSERQVAVENLPSCNLDENVDRSSKLSPVRSHSFQTVASMKSNKNLTDQRSIPREVSFNEVSFSNNSIPGKSGVQSKGSCTGDSTPISTFVINSGRKSYSKSSPTAIRKKYANEDISHQPVYQNSHNAAQSQMVATIIAKCTNNNNFRAGSTESRDQENTTSRKLSTQFTKNSIPTSSSSENDLESSFCKHFDSLERASRSADISSAENNNKVFNRNKSSNCMGIAQKKAIPKFLPRPSYIGKHVPVCSLYDVSESKFAMKEEVDNNTSSWSSEDDLYTDGTSHLYNQNNDNCKRFNAITSLPPIPIDCRRQSPASKSEDSDDNGIYEQIGEPLYEEVPDTISYSSGTSAGSGSMGHPRKSIFEGASKTEILSYLEDAKERGVENISSTEEAELLQEEDDGEMVNETADEHENQKTLSSKRNHRNRISNLSNLSDSSQTSEESFQNEESKDKDTRYGHCNVEVERNDSGVGSETSKPSRLRRQSRLEESTEQICVDCDLAIDKIWENGSGSCYVEPLVCKKCSKKRCERKEIILEFVETEIKYGRDLRIIKEEFQRPMLVAGLLSEELLSNIFLNLDQLIEVNDKFTEKLKDALDIAAEHGDEDYNTVNVGKMFLDSSSMLPAFETYCVRQGTASMLLTNLEKEKELLRIFLKVSQMENTLLRRLNLNSFLMVPVQRVTKYPLLINRLYKVTPHHHQDREALREGQLKIELHLEHINQQAKDFSGMNIWRRISNMSNPQRRNLLEPVIGNIKMRKMALEILQWNSDEVRFAMEGRLHYTQINENLWNKREKSIKLATIHGLLITLGNPNSDYRPDLADRDLIFPRNTGIREATLVLIKEKNNRFNLVREPLPLQRCVISCDPEVEEMFEVQEFTSKDAYLIKGDDIKDTQEWLKMLRYHAKDLGAWRRRRNALANIMINGMAARREWL